MQKLRLRPVPADRKVRIPYSGGAFLPADGARVSYGQYWLIQLKEGTVEHVPQEAPKVDPEPAEDFDDGEIE